MKHKIPVKPIYVKGDGAWNEVLVGFVWVCTHTNIVCTFHPKYVPSMYNIKQHPLQYFCKYSTYWHVPSTGNDTMCAWHVCGGTPILNQCPYWCPTYMTLFWYIRTITQYVLVCTGLYYYTFPVLVCTQYVLVRTGSEPVHTKYPVPVMHLTIPYGIWMSSWNITWSPLTPQPLRPRTA